MNLPKTAQQVPRPQIWVSTGSVVAMVSRKTSLPYPASPSAQNTDDPFAPASHLTVDTSDVPPVPIPARHNSIQRQADSFMDNDNPWQDHSSSTSQPVPDALQAGRPGHQREHSLTNIPQALRAGGSGQDTPRSSIDSGDSRDWWDDDDAADGDRSPRRSPVREVPESLRPRGHSPGTAPQPPSPAAIKRKPVGSNTAMGHESAATQPEFASNNPFRRPSSDAPLPPAMAPPPIPSAPKWNTEGRDPQNKGKTPVRDPAFSASITDFSRMSIHNGQMPDPSGYERVQSPPIASDNPWNQPDVGQPPLPPPPPQAPAPPVPEYESPPPPSLSAEQPDQLPTISFSQPHQDHPPNPWGSQPEPPPTPSPIPFDQSQKHNTQYNENLLDRGKHTGTLPLQDELLDLPNASQHTQSYHEPSLLDDDENEPASQAPAVLSQNRSEDHVYAPPPGHPPGSSSLGGAHALGDEALPTKPPRPAVRTAPLSAAEIAKNAESRNETYQIKHFNWFDHISGRLRRSSMLTQNKNGPCPLLALVNALILGAKDESQASLDDALRSREQVSLGLIIETLMYELVDRSSIGGQQLPDVDELNAFLMRLRTGMNANPRFIPPATPAPNIMDARNSIMHLPQSERAQIQVGTFEATSDMRLYGAFSVPLIHGWIPEPGSEAAQAFARSAQTYEDAQAIQFGEEELEYKLTRDGLQPDEQRVWEDITSIKNFFKLHPTQLTPTGLHNIQQSLQSGSFAIMFRNDHFSTVYKHPQSGQLFILVTDQGYADRDEIVWESLVDISGKGNDFFSGDFMPVSHQQGGGSSSSAQPQHLAVDQADDAPLSPQQQQEQHDADFAMALQMQEEEEQRQRADQARRRRSGQGPGNNPSHSPRNSNSNIPITLHPTRSRQSQSDAPENRPTIPPRSQRPTVPATNRPTDANTDDTPPSYEEAAKGKPYVPPLGSPLHPSSGPGTDSISPMSSNAQLTGVVSNAGSSISAHPPGPNAPYYGSSSNNSGRPAQTRIPSNSMPGRVSAYNEQASTPTQQMPGAYWDGRRPQQGMPAGPSGRPGRQPGQERDCVVM